MIQRDAPRVGVPLLPLDARLYIDGFIEGKADRQHGRPSIEAALEPTRFPSKFVEGYRHGFTVPAS